MNRAWIPVAGIAALVAGVYALKAQQVGWPPPAGSQAFLCVYNASPPAITTGTAAFVQCDSTGSVRTSGGSGGGDATAANQTLQITQETAINTVLGTTADAAATAGSTGTEAAKLRLMTTQLASILTAVSSAIPAGTATIGNVNGAPNATPTNCSGTITSGGTAQNAFTAGATKHGFTIMNLSTENMWVSFTTTAAADTVASYMLNPAATGVAGGSYSTPFGFGMNTALSVIGATTGNKFSCTWW